MQLYKLLYKFMPREIQWIFLVSSIIGTILLIYLGISVQKSIIAENQRRQCKDDVQVSRTLAAFMWLVLSFACISNVCIGVACVNCIFELWRSRIIKFMILGASGCYSIVAMGTVGFYLKRLYITLNGSQFQYSNCTYGMFAIGLVLLSSSTSLIFVMSLELWKYQAEAYTFITVFLFYFLSFLVLGLFVRALYKLQTNLELASSGNKDIIKVMTTCLVLGFVCFLTSLIILFALGTRLALRLALTKQGVNPSVEAVFAAMQIFGFIVDPIINLVCMMLQFSFWGHQKYQYLCNRLNDVCVKLLERRIAARVKESREEDVELQRKQKLELGKHSETYTRSSSCATQDMK